MAIVANYLHAYLQSGGQSVLTCHQLFTDGTSGPCVSPTYASSDSGVVAVSSTGKLSEGSGEGFATITVIDAGKGTQVYVWVRNSLKVPHFSGSGECWTPTDRADHYSWCHVHSAGERPVG
jgi:hypothetical protein